MTVRVPPARQIISRVQRRQIVTRGQAGTAGVQGIDGTGLRPISAAPVYFGTGHYSVQVLGSTDAYALGVLVQVSDGTNTIRGPIITISPIDFVIATSVTGGVIEGTPEDIPVGTFAIIVGLPGAQGDKGDKGDKGDSGGGGGGITAGYVSGDFYTGIFGGLSNQNVAQGTLTAMRVEVKADITIHNLMVCALGSGTHLRVGIYSDTNGAPDALIIDAGQIDVSSSGESTVTLSQALSQGMYWLVSEVQGSDASLQCTGAALFYSGLIGVAHPYSTGPMSGYSRPGTGGALPATWGATINEINSGAPIIWFKPA